MASKGKAVAVVEETSALAVAASAYGEDAGAGFEDVSTEDLVIARISILQKMSPQVDEDNPAYIPGAKAGKLLNSVTGQLYDKEGFGFIPVHRVHEFLEFIPRDAGGGFKGAHAPESDVVAAARAAVGGNWGKIKTSEGNDLIETFNVYGLLLNNEGGYESAVLSFSSTNIKTFKRWITMARSVTLVNEEDGRRFVPPLFSHIFRISTVYLENAKGSWYAYDVKWEGGNAAASRLAPTDELYQAAKLFRDMVTSGLATARYEEAGKASSEVDDAF